jgi:bacillithiol biosynthesis cysteine-adding enzyme BshC
MRLEAYQWRQTNPLTEAYLRDLPEVGGFFDYDPRNEAEIIERMNWVDHTDALRADRGRLSKMLESYNRLIGNDPAAIHAVRSLSDPGTLVVVGGQQAGLFTGPLYVIYKAITIIRRARYLSGKLGRTVVPVFWIAGEDHDFDEVNHAFVMNPQLSIEKIMMQPENISRTAVSRIPIEPQLWESAISRLDESLMDTEFKGEILDKIRSISQESSTLVEFFSRMMAWLFGSYGLVLMDSDHPDIRGMESPIFERLLNDHQSINDALWSAKSKVEAAGYAPQAEVKDGAVNLFIHHCGERILLIKSGEGYTDRKGDASYTLEQLMETARHHPESLSNNVFTRPLMQEYLFPSLETVLGPGEIAYWALLRNAFHALGFRMPIIVPRLQFTLIEGTVQKQMRKFALTPDDVLYHFDSRKQEWLKEQDKLDLEQRFSQVREGFLSMYEPIIEAVAAINPGLEKLGRTNSEKILEQITFLESRSKDALASQYESALRQWDRIHTTILPLEKPQERVYNVVGYLNKYGRVWLDELIHAEMDKDSVHHLAYF